MIDQGHPVWPEALTQAQHVANAADAGHVGPCGLVGEDGNWRPN